MSDAALVPIIEQVCVKTESRVVGYRDLTDAEALEAEQFSANVPQFKYEDWILPVVDPVILPGYMAPPLKPSPEHPTPGSEVPLPAAFVLFAAALAALYLYGRGRDWAGRMR